MLKNVIDNQYPKCMASIWTLTIPLKTYRKYSQLKSKFQDYYLSVVPSTHIL